jgi:hypothetical protein
MDESHGKEIDLQKTTIKIPGSNKPRIGKSLIQVDTNRINNDINMLSLNGNGNLNGIDKNPYDDVTHSLPHQPGEFYQLECLFLIKMNNFLPFF